MTCYTDMTNLFLFRIYAQNPSTSVCLAPHMIMCCLSELIFTLYVGSTNQNLSKQFASVYPSFFCKLHAPFNPTNKNLIELGLEIQTALSRQPFRITHVFKFSFLLIMTNTITPQNIDLSSSIILYLGGMCHG